MQILTGVVSPQFVGRCGRKELEIGLLSSPLVTSYRLPIVTIGQSLTVFAVLRLVTDRQTDGIGLAEGGTMHYIARLPKIEKNNLMCKLFLPFLV